MVAQVPRAFLSVEEFRRAFPIGKTSLYEAIRRGDIASVTMGARRLIPASELDRLRQAAEATLRSDGGDVQ